MDAYKITFKDGTIRYQRGRNKYMAIYIAKGLQAINDEEVEVKKVERINENEIPDNIQ